MSALFPITLVPYNAGKVNEKNHHGHELQLLPHLCYTSCNKSVDGPCLRLEHGAHGLGLGMELLV